jgi:hypothetical protein
LPSVSRSTTVFGVMGICFTNAPPLAILLQFEVNNLNGNLIALSFGITYVMTHELS